MNRKLKKLAKDLERAGGRLIVPNDLPDDLPRFLAHEIASCPDCLRAMSEPAEILRRRGEREERRAGCFHSGENFSRSARATSERSPRRWERMA